MKEFLAEHSAEAIGIIIAAITAIGVFVGPWFASWRQRKNTEQDRKLKAHFEDLKREAEKLISLAPNLKEGDMRIVAVDTRWMSDSFKEHFFRHRQTEEWKKWQQEVGKHNANCEDFRQKIKIAFGSKEVPVKRKDQGKFSTCIYEDAVNELYKGWKCIAQGRPPSPDLRKIESTPVEGGYELYPSGWEATKVAFAKTKDEQEKCKLVLAEIADDVKSQRRAAEICDSTNKLERKVKEFVDQLGGEISDIDKFWPGKKANKFKRLKRTCPDCKELF